MSDVYLAHAVTNLAYGLRQIADLKHPSYKLFREVSDVMFPLPTVYPNARLIPASGQQALNEGSGAGYTLFNQTFTIGVRVYVGKVGEQYDKNLLRLMWRVQPLIMNYINDHAELVFTATQAADLADEYATLGVSHAHIDGLSPLGAICRISSRLGTFRDQPEHFGMEFAIELPFQVETDRENVWFPDS